MMASEPWLCAMRATAEAQRHSSGDVHGVSVKPSQLLVLLDAIDACDKYTNWHDPRVLPSEEVPDIETALVVARRRLAEAVSSQSDPEEAVS